ncbi:MAG: TMEM175 family protein [Chloroflexia bacterium]
MVREKLMKEGVGHSGDFRWRGRDVTRIEGFSDAAFGFALTLLVVSLEVPKTFNDLLTAMQGFGGFAISFLMLMFVWYQHYTYFRRYGLQDVVTIWLSSALLFVVLFYVYPLKFLFNLLVGQIFEGDAAFRLPDGTLVIQPGQGSTLLIIYGAGFVAVFLVFALLYYHAYRKRDELGLTEIETNLTTESVQTALLSMGVGALSIIAAAVGGNGLSGWAGPIYFLIPVIYTFEGMTWGRRNRKLKGRATAAD